MTTPHARHLAEMRALTDGDRPESAAREVTKDVEATISRILDAAEVDNRDTWRTAIAKAIADAEARGIEVAYRDAESRIANYCEGMPSKLSQTFDAFCSIFDADGDIDFALLRLALVGQIHAACSDAEARGREAGRAGLNDELRRAVELRAQAVREAHSGALTGLEEAARLEMEAAGLASYGDSPETTAREAHIFAVKCVKRAVAAEAKLREIEAGRGDALAAPPTVGGLLASLPIVEWRLRDDWFQARIDRFRDGRVRGASLRWRHVDARSWSTWGQPWGTPAQHMGQPARLVEVSEADKDPATRGPIVADEGTR